MYSYEWVSGQEPRLTQKGKNITCKTDNFVPLVEPGLSSASGSSSSSTSKPQDQSNNSTESESASSNPVKNRRDKPAAGNRMQTVPDKPVAGSRQHDTQDEKDTEDPTQEVPEWLQNFTANLEDLEKHVPAHSSERENSDSEASTKWLTNQNFGNILFILISKRPKLRRMLQDQDYKDTMQKTPFPRADKFGDLITADHKVLNEEGESRNNHRYAVVVQDLATQWIQSLP